jgi:hypothetical protein
VHHHAGIIPQTTSKGRHQRRRQPFVIQYVVSFRKVAYKSILTR